MSLESTIKVFSHIPFAFISDLRTARNAAISRQDGRTEFRDSSRTAGFLRDVGEVVVEAVHHRVVHLAVLGVLDE